MPHPAQEQELVAVYNYRDYSNGFESPQLSSFKATRQAILERFRGDPVEATEEWVHPAELDDRGRYQRLPTGWGDLGKR